MPSWLNYLLTAAATGAAGGFATCFGEGAQMSWARCGIAAAIGALSGAINLWRTTPVTHP